MASYVAHHLSTLPSPESSYKAIERLAPYWGDKKLDDICKAAVLRYKDHRKQEFRDWQRKGGYKTTRKLSDQTVRREIDVSQAAINFGHRENVISICPAYGSLKNQTPHSMAHKDGSRKATKHSQKI